MSPIFCIGLLAGLYHGLSRGLPPEQVAVVMLTLAALFQLLYSSICAAIVLVMWWRQR